MILAEWETVSGTNLMDKVSSYLVIPVGIWIFQGCSLGLSDGETRWADLSDQTETENPVG